MFLNDKNANKNWKFIFFNPLKENCAICFHSAHQRLCLLEDEYEVLDDRSLSRRLSSSPRLRLFIGLRGSLTSFEYQSSFFVDASLAKTSPCSSNLNVCVSQLSLFSSSSSSTMGFLGASSVDASDAELLMFSNFDLNLFSSWRVNCSLQKQFTNINHSHSRHTLRRPFYLWSPLFGISFLRLLYFLCSDKYASTISFCGSFSFCVLSSSTAVSSFVFRSFLYSFFRALISTRMASLKWDN